MLQISDTAYPRLKAHPTTRELESSFTPTLAELAFAAQHTRRPTSHVAWLVFLKTFQRLGYFVKLTAVPAVLLQHVAHAADFCIPPKGSWTMTVEPPEIASWPWYGPMST